MPDSISPEFVEFAPPELNDGVLYISMTYATAVHLCACGCGNKVVTPISRAEWQLFYDGESVSLWPSIGNWEFPCRSHYWIRRNKITWASGWTDEEIADGRRRDAEDLEDYFHGRAVEGTGSWSTQRVKPRESILQRFLRLIGWR